MNFQWNGKVIETNGNLFDAAAALETPDEGARFMAEYTAYLASENVPDASAVAGSNIGYLAGYGDEATRSRIAQLTSAVHPIFGSQA
jgi:hypothetical protein